MDKRIETDRSPYPRLLVDHTPSLLAYWDRDLRCRFANRAFENWFGIGADKLVGRSLREVLGNEAYVRNELYLQAALKGKEQVFELVIQGRDDVEHHSLAHCIPDLLDGEVVGLAVQVTEVTQLKQAEVALQRVVQTLEAEIRSRRSAEEQLVDLQQSLAVTLASIGAGFLATDRDGRVTRMNAVAELVTGWSQKEAHGRILWDVLAREDLAGDHLALNPVDVMIEQGITVDVVHHVTVMSRDGRRTALEMKADLMHARDGSIRGLTMVFRDLTRMMQAQLESNRLAAIVESSYDAIVGKTLDGCITSWNIAAQALFGYSAQEAIGQPVQMLIPPEREFEEMRVLADLAHGARVPPFDTIRLARDGRRLEVSVTISPIRDALGRIVGASKIARDVSSQRRAEAALRESEARLRFAMESAQIGAWDMDPADGLIRRSLQHDRCFGYDSMQPEWRFEIFLRHVHPDDRAEVARGFRGAVDNLQDWKVECRAVWSDSSVHWIRMHGSVQLDGGRATRVVGIVSDTTQQKAAEEDRQKSQRLELEQQKMREGNRLKNLFLANMSHELRTPLNAIIGFADLLLAGAVSQESPKHREFLGHIGSSGRHLLQLINDVLDLSKIESGNFSFFPEAVDLQVLVSEVSGVLQTTIQKKNIGLSIEIDRSLTGIELDPGRLKQILYNYLANAIKFTQDGGRIAVRAQAEGSSFFRMEVEDNGVGIAEADQSRLFVEFQQLDSSHSRRHQGTGLGLALSRRLAQAQGGEVGVRSSSGQGSVFYLVMPRVVRVPETIDPAAGMAGHRMLVIESEQTLQARLVHALSEAGFRADAASTGQQAVQQALDRTYDAFTLALRLADRSGLEVLAAIRSHSSNRHAPVLGVAMPTEAGTVAGFAIANVLSKPIRDDDLVTVMARLQAREAGTVTVMVIDDDPLALDLMRTSLEGIGIRAVCIDDGRKALREIGQVRPDAVILDLMMPELDGFEVLAELRGMAAWKDLPVFIWTSMVLTEDEYARLARSARAVLSKGGGEVSAMLESVRRWQPPVDRLRA